MVTSKCPISAVGHCQACLNAKLPCIPGSWPIAALNALLWIQKHLEVIPIQCLFCDVQKAAADDWLSPGVCLRGGRQDIDD